MVFRSDRVPSGGGTVFEVHASTSGPWSPRMGARADARVASPPCFEHGWNLLIILYGFHGCSAQRLWGAIALNVLRFTGLERLAIIGADEWKEYLIRRCRQSTRAQIRYYGHTDIDTARAWVTEDHPCA